MRGFVRDLNIASFVRQLEHELNPAKRATLKSLLLQEEDKFGRAAEKLNRIDHLIIDGQARVARQKDLIKDLRSRGSPVEMAERVLANLEEVQALLVVMHLQIKALMNGFGSRVLLA